MDQIGLSSDMEPPLQGDDVSDKLQTVANDERKLRHLGETFCPQYQTQVHFFVEDARESNGIRHLVVQYANGRRECRVGLPQWTDEELLQLLLSAAWEGLSHPVWEHTNRYFANAMLTWPSAAYCYVPVAGISEGPALQEKPQSAPAS
jgi:hypothetical protein